MGALNEKTAKWRLGAAHIDVIPYRQACQTVQTDSNKNTANRKHAKIR
jgi:hypothetical protein